MKTLIIAATAALIAGPALAIGAEHFESPAEAAAYGVSFDGSADTSILVQGIDSPAEMNGLFAVDGNAVVSTKNVGGQSSILINGLDSPAEQAAAR